MYGDYYFIMIIKRIEDVIITNLHIDGPLHENYRSRLPQIDKCGQAWASRFYRSNISPPKKFNYFHDKKILVRIKECEKNELKREKRWKEHTHFAWSEDVLFLVIVNIFPS